MLKKILTVGLILIIIALLGWLIWRLTTQNSSLEKAGFDSSRPLILTSIYPLADFVQNITTDETQIFNLTPAGVEPHDYEPSPQDLVLLSQADYLIYNGAGLDGWVNRISNREYPSLKIVPATQNIDLMTDESDQADPHAWLDPVLAAEMVKNIAAATQIASDSSTLAAYLGELKALDQDFRDGLRNCEKREIVTAHNAFAYLARRYGLEVKAIAGLDPNMEPSPKKMAEITQFIRDNQVKYIFSEELLSPKLAETLARETGAEVVLFNPLESLTAEQIAAGENYISVQKENLMILKKALNCP